LAKETVTVLSKNHKIITAGRKDCDVYCDITQEVIIPSDIDVVINFAAVFSGDSDEEIINAEKTNSLGTLNICVAAKKSGAEHIINISSLSAMHDESSPYYSIYAITKRHADELAKFYCGLNKIPLTVLRPSQIYADSDAFAEHQPFFYQIVDKAESGEDITIYGKNDALRNYIHAVDLAEVISRVIQKQVTGVYACMYPSNITFSEIAHTAQTVFAKGGKILFVDNQPDIPDNIFDSELTIYEKIEYHPGISINEGLKRIKAYREEKSA